MNPKAKLKLEDLMIDKSQESFLLALEIYNKPTIKYRVEGFCFFICNAWELLLKSYLIKKGISIHYKDKQNKNRTISLSDCIGKIMTNKNDPVRKNLEAVMGLRHMAVHLVVPEYANLYNDVFMACVKNYTIKLKTLLDKNIDDKLPNDYITMFIAKDNPSVDITTKYGKEIVEKFLSSKNFINRSLIENSKNDVVNDSFAVSYELSVKKVKNIAEADFTVANVAEGKSQLNVITVNKKVDPSETHPFTLSKVVDMVKSEMQLKGITFTPTSEKAKTTFTTNTFQLLNSFFHFKDDEELSYKHEIGNSSQYTYSVKIIQTIINIFSDDPSILLKIKANPRSKGILS